MRLFFIFAKSENTKNTLNTSIQGTLTATYRHSWVIKLTFRNTWLSIIFEYLACDHVENLRKYICGSFGEKKAVERPLLSSHTYATFHALNTP